MKITDIRMIKLVGPLLHGQGGTTTETCSKIVVRVDTDSGIYGLGEAEDFFGIREAIAYMRNYFVGRDALDINPIVSEMLYATLPPHHSRARHGSMPGGMSACPASSPTATPWGPVLWACSGVEMALCDLAGKALGVPVYKLLGGAYRNKIRIYLDRSAPAELGQIDQWRKMADDAVNEGFTQAKFDIDYIASDCEGDVWNRSLSKGQIDRIVERLSVVRKHVGSAFEICADCHMQYDVPTSIRIAQALEPLRLLWLEDPTPITNPVACAEVREKSPIAICVGEMFSAEQFNLFTQLHACDILHPDVLFCGGLHEARKIADHAELHYLPMAMHGNGGALATIAAAHVAAASRNFLGLEYHFIETPWIERFVTRGEPLFKEGHIVLSDAPGLGVELDSAVCAQYLAPGEVLF